MFEINYRIITEIDHWRNCNLEQIDKEGGIEGFFQLVFNNEEYGYYHNRDLAEGEEGFDLISTWFDNLMEVCLHLEASKYVALKDIETYNTWIEFIPKEDQISVSLMKSDPSISEFIILKPLSCTSYPEWKDILIPKEEFKSIVIQRTKEFIDELLEINKLFIQSQEVSSLLDLLSKINNTTIKD
ncbi:MULTISPECIES: hypothetical protein [Paenibacillus]|uniref:hypothetical protein n=1 Tax=Paenibacillus TaxID=44249 RepID=UPI00020D7640|nr:MULTISPECIES: hypothetical protein [Paenibacillus]EGL15053.1 hypothetical protein HMPREF9413_2054 [Paenibacillus sp. HGF7]EPD82214.1 hypothetical protein HMPREF1207_04040 [Paenibacillus sp. HGH0039]MBV6714154.1 hypothetical protein [Paenibacillus chitinolyticus]